MLNRFFFLLLSVFLCGGGLLDAGPAAAAGDRITVEAEAYGSSRSDALLKAKREAVSQGIGTVLVSETEIKNFILQKDRVLTRTIGSVLNYKVLDAKKEDDGTYFIKIRATVSTASIRQDLAALKILLESMDKPRMMVLVKEKDGRNAETAILDYLSEKGFDLVDAAAAAALMNKDDALLDRAVKGDPVAAAKIGAANGAEYVLVGSVAKSVGEKNGMLADVGMVSGQATISARVINCSTARVVASKNARAAAAHISAETAMNTAAAKAARQLMDRKLFEKIVASFQDTVNNGAVLEVEVRGVPDYRTQKAVKKALDVEGVASLAKRSFSGGTLKLSVTFRGNADSFADKVDGRAVKGKKLVVTDVTGNRLVINLK